MPISTPETYAWVMPLLRPTPTAVTVAGQLVWVDGEQPERYGFSLCRVVDPGSADERYDLLGVIEVPLDQRHPERVADQLHPWAVATLQAGGYGFGRYLAELTGLDEDGEPWHHVHNEQINWSGTTVLVPAAELR